MASKKYLATLQNILVEHDTCLALPRLLPALLSALLAAILLPSAFLVAVTSFSNYFTMALCTLAGCKPPFLCHLRCRCLTLPLLPVHCACVTWFAAIHLPRSTLCLPPHDTWFGPPVISYLDSSPCRCCSFAHADAPHTRVSLAPFATHTTRRRSRLYCYVATVRAL